MHADKESLPVDELVLLLAVLEHEGILGIGREHMYLKDSSEHHVSVSGLSSDSSYFWQGELNECETFATSSLENCFF